MRTTKAECFWWSVEGTKSCWWSANKGFYADETPQDYQKLSEVDWYENTYTKYNYEPYGQWPDEASRIYLELFWHDVKGSRDHLLIHIEGSDRILGVLFVNRTDSVPFFMQLLPDFLAKISYGLFIDRLVDFKEELFERLKYHS